MGQPAKVQVIKRRKGPDQYYVNFPTAIAKALGLGKGEEVEWIIEDKANVVLHRCAAPPPPPVPLKKTRRLAARAAAPRCGRNSSAW